MHGSLMMRNVDSLTWKQMECMSKIPGFCLFSAYIRMISLCKQKKYEELYRRDKVENGIFTLFLLLMIRIILCDVYTQLYPDLCNTGLF